jgi:hypothetical protein
MRKKPFTISTLISSLPKDIIKKVVEKNETIYFNSKSKDNPNYQEIKKLIPDFDVDGNFYLDKDSILHYYMMMAVTAIMIESHNITCPENMKVHNFINDNETFKLLKDIFNDTNLGIGIIDPYLKCYEEFGLETIAELEQEDYELGIKATSPSKIPMKKEFKDEIPDDLFRLLTDDYDTSYEYETGDETEKELPPIEKQYNDLSRIVEIRSKILHKNPREMTNKDYMRILFENLGISPACNPSDNKYVTNWIKANKRKGQNPVIIPTFYNDTFTVSEYLMSGKITNKFRIPEHVRKKYEYRDCEYTCTVFNYVEKSFLYNIDVYNKEEVSKAYEINEDWVVNPKLMGDRIPSYDLTMEEFLSQVKLNKNSDEKRVINNEANKKFLDKLRTTISGLIIGYRDIKISDNRGKIIIRKVIPYIAMVTCHDLYNIVFLNKDETIEDDTNAENKELSSTGQVNNKNESDSDIKIEIYFEDENDG